jgi:methylmalonyl-CoA/ethylmalonyl-CoA epimerase
VAVKGIHHLGVAVGDLEAAVDAYRSLFGAHVEHRETVVDQGVDACSLRVGETRLELLSPLGEDTPVGKFLAKRGPGMHHVAFEVDDIGSELHRLQSAGVQLIDERPRRGMFGLDVAFIHPEATGGVLAELVSDG